MRLDHQKRGFISDCVNLWLSLEFHLITVTNLYDRPNRFLRIRPGQMGSNTRGIWDTPTKKEKKCYCRFSILLLERGERKWKSILKFREFELAVGRSAIFLMTVENRCIRNNNKNKNQILNFSKPPHFYFFICFFLQGTPTHFAKNITS